MQVSWDNAMSRMLASLAALLSLSMTQCAGAAPPGADAARVTLTIEPAVESLYEGDVLIVKCVLRNQGKEAISLSKPLDAHWAGIRFEASPPKDQSFARLYALGEGLGCGIPVKIQVGAGESIACYERFHAAGKSHPFFSTQGKWQLRALVTLGDAVLTSEPVTVEVVAAPDHLKRDFKEHAKLVHGLLVTWDSSEDELIAMRKAKGRLAGTSSARVLSQSVALNDLRNATAARVRLLALEAIDKSRVDFPPVEREYYELLTAQVLVRDKDFGNAEKILKELQRSTQRDALRYAILEGRAIQGK